MKSLLSLILVFSIAGAVVVVIKILMLAFTVMLGVAGMVFLLSLVTK